MLGETPPNFGAKVLRVEIPAEVEAGKVVEATIVVLNSGQQTWLKDKVGLVDQASWDGKQSVFYHDSWPDKDVLARVLEDVPPGQSTTLKMLLRAPDKVGAVEARFAVVTPAGEPMACPRPSGVLSTAVVEPPTPKPPKPSTPNTADEGCASTSTPSPGGRLSWLVFALVFVGWRRRRVARTNY